MIAAVAIVGLCLPAVLLVFARQAFVRPGPLSRPHAMILAGDSSQGCAACHPAASKSVSEWFFSAGTAHLGVAQSERCLDCHHTRPAPQHAKSPHNLPPRTLAALRERIENFGRSDHAALSLTTAHGHDMHAGAAHHPAIDRETECAVCHREHHGAEADLSRLTDAQCQSCHSRSFKSFSNGHPQWTDWPYVAPPTIAFDHSRHAGIHFPKSRSADGTPVKFDCQTCHPGGSDGEPLRTAGYEVACAQCHDAGLRQQSAGPLDLVVLPMLGEEAAREAKPWPAAATGWFEGDLPPLLRRLIRDDPAIAAAMDYLPTRSSFETLDPTNRDHRRAAVAVAESLRSEMQRLAANGTSGLSDHSDNAALRRLLRSLPPQLVESAADRWFGDSDAGFAATDESPMPGPRSTVARAAAARTDRASEADRSSDQAAGDDDLLDLDDDLLGGDPLDRGDTLGDPLNPAETPSGADAAVPHRFDPARALPDGGWYRDDVRMAIAYRGGGHADSVLKAAVELAAGLPEDDTVRRELLQSGPIAACVECHPGSLRKGSTALPDAAGSSLADDSLWSVRQTGNNRRGRIAAHGGVASLTRFAHAPHVISDCTHCHKIESSASPRTHEESFPVTFTDGRPLSPAMPQPHHGFAPLQLEVCSDCHRPGGARESCTQCHRYHAEP